MDNRLSIKFENGQYEQVYKFRSGEGVDRMHEAQALVNQEFITKVQQFFAQMHQLKMETLASQVAEEADEFEEII